MYNFELFEPISSLLDYNSSRAQAWTSKSRRAIEPRSSLPYDFQAELKPCQARARLGSILALHNGTIC